MEKNWTKWELGLHISKSEVRNHYYNFRPTQWKPSSYFIVTFTENISNVVIVKDPCVWAEWEKLTEKCW